jgi:hypothetical protein
MRGLAALALAAASTALWAFPAAASGPRIGEVKTVEGEVTIEGAGGARAAAPGAPLRQSDVVRTGPAGAVGMTFTDNSRISLGPSSELSLERYLFSGGRGAFDARLNRGSMTAASGQIARNPEAMRVLIPSGVLGVRGTEFAVRVSE